MLQQAVYWTETHLIDAHFTDQEWGHTNRGPISTIQDENIYISDIYRN